MLLVTLSLSPIRLLTGRTWQLQYRRMLGLFMFFYACLHITTYLWLDYSFIWVDIVKDIIKHPYVLVGASAFLLTLPLAITSNNFMIRLLRERWKLLHNLVYLIAILGVVHFLWLVKKDIREPLLYAAILALLLGIRIYYKILSNKAKR
jgi:sulfoxide reductase heme-binding subunit YedZ